MPNHIMRHETTAEIGAKVWIDCALCVDFDFSPADPAVGAEKRVSINDIWIEAHGARLCGVSGYDRAEIEPMCWEHLETMRFRP